MATAQDLIYSAAKLAGILAQSQTIEGGVNADALTILNQMIARWRNSGVNLGLPAALAADTIFVDTADDEAIKINLALRLMVEFKRPIPAGVSVAGSDAFDELQAKYMAVREMPLDTALTRKYLPRKRPADQVS